MQNQFRSSIVRLTGVQMSSNGEKGEIIIDKIPKNASGCFENNHATLRKCITHELNVYVYIHYTCFKI